MDEPCTLLGSAHRKCRHDPNVTPAEAKEIFGDLADHACLDHIRLDELGNRKGESAESSSEMRIARTPVVISVQSNAGDWIVESDAVSIFRDNRSRFTYLPRKYEHSKQ
jgi:hypothetical protein